MARILSLGKEGFLKNLLRENGCSNTMNFQLVDIKEEKNVLCLKNDY